MGHFVKGLTEVQIGDISSLVASKKIKRLLTSKVVEAQASLNHLKL